jgi:tetratricopeptide (TPR) repeat protein
MNTNHHNAADIQIDHIRRQFGVSLEEAFRCRSEKQNEIQDIGKIFLLKGGNKEKVLALLYLFSSGEEDDIIKKYRDQTGLNKESYNGNLVDKYKTLLITALIYNPAFYAMTRNFREAVKAGFIAGEIDETILPGNHNAPVVPFTVVSRNKEGNSPAKRITRRRFIALGAAAGLLALLFLTLLIGLFGSRTGVRVNNPWVSSLREPQKDANGISYLSAPEGGARIELLSPLVGMAMGTDDKNDAASNPTADYYTKVIRRDGNNAEAYVNRGVAYALKGYLDSAVKDFSRAIELDPQNAAAYYNRAIAYAGKETGETALVTADFEAAIAISPEDKDTYYAIGAFYCRQYENDSTRPRELIEKAVNAFEHIRGYKDSDIILVYLSKLNENE